MFDPAKTMNSATSHEIGVVIAFPSKFSSLAHTSSALSSAIRSFPFDEALGERLLVREARALACPHGYLMWEFDLVLVRGEQNDDGDRDRDADANANLDAGRQVVAFHLADLRIGDRGCGAGFRIRDGERLLSGFADIPFQLRVVLQLQLHARLFTDAELLNGGSDLRHTLSLFFRRGFGGSEDGADVDQRGY